MADSQRRDPIYRVRPMYRERRRVQGYRRPSMYRGALRVVRWVVNTCFVLALLLSLVMAALFVYKRLYYYPTSMALSSPVPSAATVVGKLPGSWRVLPSLPAPQADNASVYVQLQGRGYVYMSGGYHGHAYSPHYDHNLYRYDVAAGQWQVVVSGDFPGMVNNAMALDEQNDLFFVSGYSSDVFAVTSLLYEYRLGDRVLQKIISPAEVTIGYGAAMLADQEGHLYISQGFVRPGDPGAHAGTGWYRYDIASGQWHVLAPLPVGLGYSVLASDDGGGILMLGGAIDAGEHVPSKYIYRYDIVNNVWIQEPEPAPVAFSGAASCADGQGHVVVVGGSGGYDASGERVLSQSWLIDLYTLHWQALAPLPAGSSLLGTAACDGAGHVFVVRGADSSSNPTKDFLMLTVG